MKCTTSLQIKSNITFSHSWKFWWWSAQNCSILVPLFSPWDHLCVIMIHSVKWCLYYSKAQRPLLVIISCYPLHKRAGCGEMLYFPVVMNCTLRLATKATWNIFEQLPRFSQFSTLQRDWTHLLKRCWQFRVNCCWLCESLTEKIKSP